MQYTFSGTLCGNICPNDDEPMANMEVRLYRTREDAKTVERAMARPKETFEILDDKRVEEKRDRLLATTETDDAGEFSVTLDEQLDYDGEAVEVDVRTDHVPGADTEDADPVQFTITLLQPRWRKAENGAITRWEYCLSRRFWCAVRERFDAWVICGRVVDCEKETPRPNVDVTAFDADIFQHDDLGTATTDTDGRFRIDYATADFERVPAPWSPIELTAGPDLYFRIESPGGSPLLVEEPSRGREPDRENAGNCFDIELCVESTGPGPQPTPERPEVEPQFTHVGQYDVTTDITTDGYAMDGSETLAFTGTLPLIGALPNGGSTPKEYRFLVGEYGADGSDPSSLDPLGPAEIASTRIGTLQAWKETSPGVWRLRDEPYWVNNAGATNNVPVSSDGWIQVPTEADLGDPDTGTPGTGLFARNSDRLVRFDSHEVLLEQFDLTTPSVHVAGDSVPNGEQSAEHVFKVVFEAREVGAPSTTHRQPAVDVVISNTRYTQKRHPSWAGDTVTRHGVVMLDIEELRGSGNGCDRLTDELQALVTAYHPHLNAARVEFEGNPPLPSTRTLTVSNGEALVEPTDPSFDISSLQPCAYNLWLHISYDLTGGYGRIDGDHDHIGFCVGTGATSP